MNVIIRVKLDRMRASLRARPEWLPLLVLIVLGEYMKKLLDVVGESLLELVPYC